MKTIKFKLSLLFTLVLLFSCLLTACGTLRKEDAGQTQDQADTNISDKTGTSNPEEADAQGEELSVSYDILHTGDTAPDFTASLADGSEFTLSGQQGKVVLLNFWATWCGPCVREMPAFEMLMEEYGEDLAILAVNCMEDTGIVDAFLAENGYTFPVAYDPDGSIVMKYPTQGIPYTLVIDGDGIIRQIYVGAADAETQYKEYKSAIDAVISDMP